MVLPEAFELTRCFEQAAIRYWLFGGNGVELVVGRSIRDHDDVDFFVAAQEAERAINVIQDQGFEWYAQSLAHGDVFYKRGDVLIDLVPIVDTANPPRTTGDLAAIEWPVDFLTPYPVEHSQGRAVTLTPQMHVQMKAIIKQFFGFDTPRPKDLLDLEELWHVM